MYPAIPRLALNAGFVCKQFRDASLWPMPILNVGTDQPDTSPSSTIVLTLISTLWVAGLGVGRGGHEAPLRVWVALFQNTRAAENRPATINQTDARHEIRCVPVLNLRRVRAHQDLQSYRYTSTACTSNKSSGAVYPV